MDNPPILSFQDVSFSFAKGRALFDHLDLTIAGGKFYLLSGASGSGKSTLLRLITRMEAPTSGTIFFRGEPVSELPPPILRRSILYIQQTPVVVDGTVESNLLLPFGFRSNHDLERPGEDTLRGMLDRLQMHRVALDQHARSLSVGQMQRLCLVRGLLLAPEVLLLDEPVSALDNESRDIVETLAEEECLQKGRTVIMISHRKFKAEKVKPIVLELSGKRIREAE